MKDNVYDFIKDGVVAYQKPIDLADGWSWSMKNHLRRSFLYKNSQFEEENDNRDLRPNKNIVAAVLNVQYRTTGFDVKDIEPYIDNANEYYKSFLVKKFHDRWVLENSIDTFIDETVESYADYGGALVRNTDSGRPEVIDLRSLAFCNQTNILAYPFCIKHSFSPAQLREFTNWGQTENGATIDLDGLITLCKDEDFIEIYELHGVLPAEWVNDAGEEKDIQQIQVVAFYQDSNKTEQGVVLFKKKMPKLPFKFLARDKIFGRALGRGGVEELFESQIWTNWGEIKVTEMLESASKMIPITNDPTIASKHPSGLKDMDNMEFLEITEGKEVRILDNYPRNLVVFNDAVNRWQEHSQRLGAASEGLMGEAPVSGTPFKLYEAQNIEAKSMHRYRQGKVAVFMEEIYREWIIPQIAKEIIKDQSFLTELSGDEIQNISDLVAIKQANEVIKPTILSVKGKLVYNIQREELKEFFRSGFLKQGNKNFIKILKDEMKDAPLKVVVNIAGKQKNLALLTDKIVNVIRQFISTPQIRQDPEMIKLLNVILESSGLSPILFGASSRVQSPQSPAGGVEPLAELGQSQLKNQQQMVAV